MPENMTMRKATVRMKRERVNLLGRFIDRLQSANCRLQEGSSSYQSALPWKMLPSQGERSVPMGALILYPGQEVVIRVAYDFHKHKLPSWQLPSDINAPVNVRCVCFSTADQVAAFEFGGFLVGSANQTMLPRGDAGVL